MKIRAVSIQEPAIFEQLVLQQIESVEDHIEILEKGLDTQWGPIILGLDSNRRLVMMLVSAVQQDDLVSRLIGIHGWLSSSFPLITRFYRKMGVDPSRGIRGLALAPGFSNAVVEGRSSLTFSVEFFRCRGVEVNGEQGILMEPYPDGPSQKSVIDPKKIETKGMSSSKPNLTEAEVRFFEQSEPLGPPV